MISKQWLLRLAFGLSLVINAFFIGGIIAMRFHGPGHGEPNPDRIIEMVSRHLAKPDEALVRETYAAHRRELWDGFNQLLIANNKLKDAVIRPELEMGDVDAALEQARQGREMIDRILREAIFEALPKLSADGRRRIVEFDSHGPPR
jgi:uncharacterized membrane protein